MTGPSPTTTLRALLTNIVDYAGLFPPAGLSMSEAVANYAEYMNDEYSWMLGKFIVPVARLDEFEISARHFISNSQTRQWQLSVLAGNNVSDEAARISKFNKANHDTLSISAVELKASHVGEIQSAMSVLPRSLETYFEIPIHNDPQELITAIARAGARAKIRTGGVTPDAFPITSDIVRVIHACVNAKVIFKATAGLHHPLRSCYRLTYAPDSPTGMMYGFLNIFLAAAFMHQGMRTETAVKLLEEQSPEAFYFSDDIIEWCGHKISHDDVMTMRKNLGASFGSCSFREPIDDLHALHYL